MWILKLRTVYSGAQVKCAQRLKRREIFYTFFILLKT